MIADSQADILRAYLVGQGLYAYPQSPVMGLQPAFTGSMPDDGSQTICLYDTHGHIDFRELRSGVVQEHYGVQIRCRAIDYVTASNVIHALANTIDAIVRQTVVWNSNTYVIASVSRMSSIIYMGQEEKNRMESFTINAIMAL